MRYIAIFADGSEMAQRSAEVLSHGWMLRLRPANGGDIVLKGLAISAHAAQAAMFVGENAYCRRRGFGGDPGCVVLFKEVVRPFSKTSARRDFAPTTSLAKEPPRRWEKSPDSSLPSFS
jgi:hypothetical protein